VGRGETRTPVTGDLKMIGQPLHRSVARPHVPRGVRADSTHVGTHELPNLVNSCRQINLSGSASKKYASAVSGNVSPVDDRP
jgi:hypothetical protein